MRDVEHRGATHSRSNPVIKTAKNIQQKLHSVLTYFVHRITNAVAEGLSSKIQIVKKAGDVPSVVQGWVGG